jgi:hypothetical protein
LLAAGSLAAQPFSFGMKGGVPLTDFINTVENNSSLSAIDHPQRYILGPTVELRLPWGVAVEADVLYRRLNYQTVPGSATAASASLVTSNDWEFPFLLKYRFASHKFVRPYIDGGIAFDRLQGLTNTIVNGVSALKNSGTTGGVFGGGLDLHILVLHIAPEIRYTRWTSQHLDLANVLNSNQNQAEFLVGVTF